MAMDADGCADADDTAASRMSVSTYVLEMMVMGVVEIDERMSATTQPPTRLAPTQLGHGLAQRSLTDRPIDRLTDSRTAGTLCWTRSFLPLRFLTLPF